MILKAALSQQG